MRLWVDVLDAAGERLGDGPIRPQRVTVKRKLDGIGSFTVTVPASAPRAQLLTAGHTVVIWAHYGGQTREMGRGVVREVTTSESAGGAVLTAKGPDALEALRRKSTLPGRVYDDQAVADVVSELAGLAGWTANVDAVVGNVTLGFDGENVLKALRTVAETTGLHFRHETGTTLTFGALGADTGLRLVQRSQLPEDIYHNTLVVLIARIRQKANAKDVVNWVIPRGRDGLTLEHSTRTSPYAVKSMSGPDGGTIYYLEDAASVAAYGQIEQVVDFSEIEALGSTAQDLENAANTLYDAAAAWLAWRRDEQEIYSVRLRAPSVPVVIKPGDKVRLVYRGEVRDVTGTVRYLDVDALHWVLDVQEVFGVEGHAVTVKLSNVDRQERDVAQLVAAAVEASGTR